MTEIELIKKYVKLEDQEVALKKFNSGYPVQYIIGNVNFYGNIIKVNENVLIPRFETEYLVEKTIKYLKQLKLSKYHILEIGTGSGCISIALKKELECDIDALDISKEALNVAKENALNNDVIINFQNIDIADFFSNKKYDLVISNPPYVPYGSNIDEKIKYEPERAIFTNGDGTYFYDVILNKIKNNLSDNYLIAFEIGDNQGKKIKEITKKYLRDSFTRMEYDYNNYERYFFVSNNDIL